MSEKNSRSPKPKHPTIHTDGGSFIGRGVEVSRGDFVGRDQHVYGDVIKERVDRKIVYGGLTSILALIVILTIVIISNVETINRQLIQQGFINIFPPANEEEVLIIIAAFNYTDNLIHTEAHLEIGRAIKAAADDLEITNIRIEQYPLEINADDRTLAEEVGERYNASMIIWGSDTGVRVTAHFLSLLEPKFDASSVRIDETEKVQLANPERYSRFITSDLPQLLTFLSFYTFSQVYYLDRDCERTIQVLETAFSSIPDDESKIDGVSGAYFRLGGCHFASNNYESAILNYNRVIEIDPQYVPAYNNRGITFTYQGDLDLAKADLDHALVLDPEYAFGYLNRSTVYIELGEIDRAIADLDQAIDLKTEFIEAYFLRGKAFATRGELERAISDYDEAILLAPNYAFAYYERGLSYYKKGDLEQAIADYDKAITINPEKEIFYHQRGIAYYDKGNVGLAKVNFDQAIELNPEFAAAYYNRALIHRKQGDLKRAIEDNTLAIELFSDDTDKAHAHNNRGLVHEDRGNLEPAILDFNQAITLNPKIAMFYNNRGNAYRMQDNLERGIEDLSKAIILYPDGREKAEAYYNRGSANYELGKYELTIADANDAITLNPEFDLAYYIRGRANLSQGNLESAIGDLYKVIDLNPNIADAYYSLARIFAMRSNFDVAYDYLKQAIELDAFYRDYARVDPYLGDTWDLPSFKSLLEGD